MPVAGGNVEGEGLLRLREGREGEEEE
jgi:hypothetical protein